MAISPAICIPVPRRPLARIFYVNPHKVVVPITDITSGMGVSDCCPRSANTDLLFKSLITKHEHDCVYVFEIRTTTCLVGLLRMRSKSCGDCCKERKGKMNERRKGGAWKVGKIIEGEDGWREGGDQREQNFI